MTNIIVAFPKLQDAQNIRAILVRNGFDVAAPCTSGAQVIHLVDELDYGIIITGYRLTDMMYEELHELIPRDFQMLLTASEGHWNERSCSDVVYVPMPIKTHMLIETLQMMVETITRRRKKRLREQPKRRSEADNALIEEAKKLLMIKNNMTEEEAHRYIQKCSMDSGNSLVETAGMVLSIYA